MSVSINGDGSVTGIDQGLNVVGVLTASGGFSGNLTGNVTGNLNSSGVSTFTNGPVLIGSGTSTGTASQRLQVTGGAYVSGRIGVGSTNPTDSLTVNGTILSIDELRSDNHLNLRKTTLNNIYFADALAFAMTGTGERARIDSSGNLQLSTANTSILNSSGRKILNQTGGILQVVQTIKTDTFTSSSTSPTAITGLSASITPSSTSSRILVMYSVNYDSNRGNSGGGFRIYRDGSHITAASGAAAGSRYTVTGDFGSNNDADQSGMHRSFTYIDSPSSTSSLTYQIYIVQDSTFTTYINRSRADADQGDDPRMSSTITLMEISG